MKLRMLAVSMAAAAPFALAGIATAAPGDFSITPTSGPAGTTITATGECEAPPAESADPSAVVVIFDEEGDFAGEGGALTDGNTFSISFTVPGDTPAGDYGVVAACFAGNSEEEEPYFEFDPVDFTVTASGGSDTPTTGGSTPPPARPTPAKAPAKPVSAQPTFTG